MAEPGTAEHHFRLPKHGQFYVGLAAGLLALVVGLLIAPRYAFAVGVNVLFAVYLLLMGRKFRRLTPDILRRHAEESDLPTWIILGVVVVTVGLSIFELFRALNGGGTPAILEVFIGLVSVLLGWFTIHTMAALHYAFEYYQSSDPATPSPSIGGLTFPDGDTPDGIAFLYFPTPSAPRPPFRTSS